MDGLVKGRQVAVTTPAMVVVVAVSGKTPGQKGGPAASAPPADNSTLPVPAAMEKADAAAQRTFRDAEGDFTF